MAVSSTASFGLTAAEIVDRALARVGGEHQPGYAAKAGRINLQLLLTGGWNNRGGGLMWLRDWATLTLVNGTARYPLAADTIDVLKAILREENGTRISATLGADPITTTASSTSVTIADADHGAQIGEEVTLSGATAVGGITPSGDYAIATIAEDTYTITHSAAASSGVTGGGSSITATYKKYTDIEMGRIGWDEHFRLPNKGTTGKLNSFAVDRQRDNPVLYVFPAHDSNTTRHVAYLRKRRLLDVAQLSDNVDIPATFLLALISGLAALLAREVPKLQQITGRTVEEFVADAERDWQLAASENRDRAPVSLMPDFSRYTS